MNTDPADSREEMPFIAPDVSQLADRSAELAERRRIIVENMKKNLLRLRYAMEQSDKIINRRPPVPDKYK